MARTANLDPELLGAITAARSREKEAIRIARKEIQALVDKATRSAHAEVVAAVRTALAGNQSARQIGLAYGSSDPTTVKKLIQEASVGLDSLGNENHPDWILTKHEDGSFDVQVMSLGETGLSGMATFTIDEDGENFSAIDGDLWIQFQLYRLGYRDMIMEEYARQ